MALSNFRRLVVLALAALSAAAAEAAELRLTTDGHAKQSPVFIGRSDNELSYVVEDHPERMRLMRLNTKSRESKPEHPDETRSEFEPAWSDDGRYLSFVQNRGNLSLGMVIQDTVEKKEVEIKPAGGFSGMRSPAFDPTRARVLFSFAEEGRQSIFSVDLSASNRKTIIDSPGVNNWPSLSPDGRQLLFGSSRDGDYELYLADADGENVRRITNEPRQDVRPRFSPDGKRISFTSNRDGNYEIYVMSVDGSGLKRITNHPERDDYAAWHPDGKRLIMVCERDGQQDLYLVDVRD